MMQKKRLTPEGRYVLVGLACGWLWSLAGPVHALNSDSRQPIDIEADSATYEERKGETLYTGNVRAAQGSLEVRGDRMVVHDKGGKTEKIVVTGNPMRLKQTPEAGKEYFPVTGILILYDQALVWQGQNSTASDRIEYDIKNGLFKAGTTGSARQRVHVRLQSK
jgi:lipopolysaccharide export system protein LptA